MKRPFIHVLAFCFIPLMASSQTSTVEYQVNAAIEVQTGADVSADNIITNSNYSGGGTFNGGPLPVTLTAMSVQATKNAATIAWRTESETENHGFEIERRVMGRMDDGRGMMDEVVAWMKRGFVAGSGTSSSPRDYSFVDSEVSPGRYAYRIKQIDHSGTFTYTSTLEVEIGLAPREFTLSQNYPNPFNPSTTIEFTLPEDGHVRLSVYDVRGRLISTLIDGEKQAGVYHQAVFLANNLSSGTYLVRLQFLEQTLQRKIILMK